MSFGMFLILGTVSEQMFYEYGNTFIYIYVTLVN